MLPQRKPLAKGQEQAVLRSSTFHRVAFQASTCDWKSQDGAPRVSLKSLTCPPQVVQNMSNYESCKADLQRERMSRRIMMLNTRSWTLLGSSRGCYSPILLQVFGKEEKLLQMAVTMTVISTQRYLHTQISVFHDHFVHYGSYIRFSFHHTLSQNAQYQCCCRK
jgi:hypothetical protein